jgi:ethanolamine utilization protein EutQ (cupin superfamily)
MGKQVITAFDITKAINAGQKALDFKEADCIVTPKARDKMEETSIGFAGVSCPAALVEKKAKETAGAQPADSAANPSENGDLTARICDLIQERLPTAGGQELEAIVKKIVADKLSGPKDDTRQASQGAVSQWGGVSLISGDLLFEQSPEPAIPGKMQVSETFRCHKDSSLTVTCMKWENTAFERIVESPEISMVVEGQFDLTVDGQTFTARPGDILYMVKGAKVAYASNDDVKLACINA